jgi:hypothetical protein
MEIRVANCLKDNLMNQKLPLWVCEIAGLDTEARFQDLPSEIISSSKAESKALNHFLVTLLNRRIREKTLREARCFPYSKSILTQDLIESLNMSVRTRNALNRYVVSTPGPKKIEEITFGDLADIENLGSKSLLEFLNAIEKYELNTFNEDAKNNLDELSSTSLVDDEIHLLISELSSFEDIDQIFRGDLRFLPLNTSLPIPNFERGSSLKFLLEESEAIFETWQISEKLRLKEALSLLKVSIEEVSKLKVDTALKHLISSYYPRAKKENLEALYNRFGVNQRGVLTLEECGQMIDVTRERIRQIESKITKGISGIPGDGAVYMPALWDAISQLNNMRGADIELISKKLCTQGFSGKPISVQGLLLFNDLLRGQRKKLKINKLKNGQRILTEENFNLGGIFNMMSKLYSRNGVANLPTAYENVEEEIVGADYDDIVSIVSSSGMWRSLDADMNWWMPTNVDDIARNRLINVARKILSVSESVTARDLKEGYDRMATFRNTSGTSYSGESSKNIKVPPENIILEFFQNIPNFYVSDENIYFDGKLNYKEELGATEAALVEVIWESEKGIISRADLMKGGASKGVNDNSLNMYITYSVVLKHAGLDMHQINGSSINAGDLLAYKETKANSKGRKRVLLADWHQGFIRIACLLPEFVTTMVVGAPSSVKPSLINKKFEVFDDDGETFANIAVNEQGTIYGMGAFCKAKKSKENDILLMSFDLLESKAILNIIDYSEYLDLLE